MALLFFEVECSLPNVLATAIEITPIHIYHSHCSINNHDNHVNGCPRVEQSTTFQNLNISEDDNLANAIVIYSSLSQQRELNVALGIVRVHSFMYTELPSLQHNVSSTIFPANFRSDTFQHNTTRDFQYANSVTSYSGLCFV
ncbi:hypothetical protein EAF00_008432 [Botryotinia globosa]|nr:hypothetical protein EAF00_008432 [Botryotinia globosa]